MMVSANVVCAHLSGFAESKVLRGGLIAPYHKMGAFRHFPGTEYEGRGRDSVYTVGTFGMNMLPRPFICGHRGYTFWSFGLMQGGDTQQPPGANHPRPTTGSSRRLGSSLDRVGGRSLNYLGRLVSRVVGCRCPVHLSIVTGTNHPFPCFDLILFLCFLVHFPRFPPASISDLHDEYDSIVPTQGHISGGPPNNAIAGIRCRTRLFRCDSTPGYHHESLGT